MLEPPVEIVYSEGVSLLRRGISDPNKIRPAMDKLKIKFPGLQVVEFKSRFIEGERSVALVIPGEKYDQYIHLFKNKSGLNNDALVLAIQKQDRNGKDLESPKSFFNQYAPLFGHLGQDPKPGVFKSITMHIDGIGSSSPDLGRCVGCHRVGAMPIVPADNKESISLMSGSSGKEVIDWVNSRVQSTANAKPDSANLWGFGPPIGEIDPRERTDDFIKSCAKVSGLELTKNNITRLKSAMNCSSCHDGHDVGLLNYPVGPSDFSHSVFETMILSGHMPPDENLDQTSRKALKDCLVSEYYGGFTGPLWGRVNSAGTFLRWLKSGSCYEPKTLSSQERSTTYDNNMGTGVRSDVSLKAK